MCLSAYAFVCLCLWPCVRTLVASVFHQPARDADDVLQHGLGQVLQGHLLLQLQLLVHSQGVQDQDGRHRLAVACQQVAELRLQKLLALLKAGFLRDKRKYNAGR